MATVELDLRGTDMSTMKEYLALLGGAEEADDRMAGDGWAVHLTPSIHRFRQWEFPRVILTFEGHPDQVAEVVRQLRVMATRGGA